MFYFTPQIGLFFSYEVPYLAGGYWWQKAEDGSNNMISGVANVLYGSYIATDDYFFGNEAWNR